MKKPIQNEIPRSIIKGSGIIRADLNFSQGKGNLLFISPRCVVVGLNDLPHMLFATDEFNEDILPLNIRSNIYELKELILQPTFSVGLSKSNTYSLIPLWLRKFTKLQCLRLEFVKIDELDSLSGLPIRHLIMENIKCTDSKRVGSAIRQFRQLKEISYDHTFPQSLKDSIKASGLKLTLIDGGLTEE